MELQLAEAVVRAIGTEYLQTAAVKHPPIHSAHEGAAILKEKYDILWEEVKRLDADRMRAAAVKLAATALRFVVETCPPTETTDNGKWTRSRKALDLRAEKEIEAFGRPVAGIIHLAEMSMSRKMDTLARPRWAAAPDPGSAVATHTKLTGNFREAAPPPSPRPNHPPSSFCGMSE